jgi:hypothetical protein
MTFAIMLWFTQVITAGAAPEDSTIELANAIKEAHGSFVLPQGTLYITRLEVPAGLSVSGSHRGKGTVLVALPSGSLPVVDLHSGAKFSNVQIQGKGLNRDGIGIGNARNVVVQNVILDDFGRYGVEADHATNLVIRDCAVSKCRRGTNLEFCHDVVVTDNWVKDVRDHGIQFWGNWNWKTKDSSNLTFSHNWVANGAGGGIWGTGATHVSMTENKVSNFGDVGLDLEWCDTAAITLNDVSNCRNGCVSLFYSCMNVSITDNLIVNHAPIDHRRPPSGRWQGIWLTGINPDVYPEDKGHSYILIARNRIVQTGSINPPIGLGSECTHVVQTANAVSSTPWQN